MPIDGVQEIYLYVTGAPDVEYGAGRLDRSASHRCQGQRDVAVQREVPGDSAGFHTVDCSLRSRVDPPLRVADEMFEHGINLQAPGKIRVTLPQGTVRFEAGIGIDDWVNPDTFGCPNRTTISRTISQRRRLRSRSAPDRRPPNGAVRFHVTDAAGAARLDLWTRLADEFSHAGPRQQMRWEREDRLLEDDWVPGDWQTLARRYAKASRRVSGFEAEAAAWPKALDRTTFDVFAPSIIEAARSTRRFCKPKGWISKRSGRRPPFDLRPRRPVSRGPGLSANAWRGWKHRWHQH